MQSLTASKKNPRYLAFLAFALLTSLGCGDDGGETGLILCKHGHCDEKFTVAQWLRFFSKPELEAARLAAGIVRAA